MEAAERRYRRTASPGRETDQGRNLVMLGGLWLNKSKAGKTYMSGRLGTGGKVMVFKNPHKRKDSDPDYYLMLGEWERGEGGRKSQDDDDPF